MRLMNARNATLKTVSAELKALTVEGKQVTLSVFRQLIRADVLNRATGELRGVPWGTVNYFWGECSPDHLHVVWQDGENLRRDCLKEVRDRYAQEWLSQERQNIFSWLRILLNYESHVFPRSEGSEAVVLGWKVTIPAELSYCAACSVDERVEEINSQARDLGSTDIRRMEAIEYARKQPHSPNSGYAWERWEGRRYEELLSVNHNCTIHDWLVALIESYRLNKEEVKNGDAAWARNYKMVEGLDQLFIAV